MNKNTNINTERDYLFDNIRAFLILLVVIGHMIAEQKGDIMAAEVVYYFIYIFHMPAFIFITGYFSKNLEKSRENAFKTFLIPYLILNILFVTLGKISLYDTNSSFRLFNPVWGMWFLLAVFIWKIMLKDLVRIKYILPLSFVFGVLSGFSDEFTEKMSLSRIINYLPFFLLGYFCKKEYIDKIRKFPKWISMVVLGLYGLISYLFSKYNFIKMEIFYMRRPYSKITQSSLTSAFGRIFIYISAIIIIICLINLFSSTSTWYTKIGQNSLTVYVLHLVAVSNIRNIELPWDRTPYYLIYSILVSFILSYLFSRDTIIKLYKSIMDFFIMLVYRNK
jgi:fucose 4-O-acetylase-like acetyltransferase